MISKIYGYTTGEPQRKNLKILKILILPGYTTEVPQRNRTGLGHKKKGALLKLPFRVWCVPCYASTATGALSSFEVVKKVRRPVRRTRKTIVLSLFEIFSKVRTDPGLAQ